MSNNTDNQENNNDFYQEIESFEELEISPNIIKGIFSYGFERPSPIQRKSN